MGSIFAEIIAGRAPARMIWTDDAAVAFLTIEPRQPGHTLVVPRLEVDRWLDLPEELVAHLMSVARQIGLAQREEWGSDRAGLMIEGYMVPHVHVHVWPSWSPFEFHPSGIDRNASPAALDEAALRLRARLRLRLRLRLNGHGEAVPSETGPSE